MLNIEKTKSRQLKTATFLTVKMSEILFDKIIFPIHNKDLIF